jgi:hypothetical protein
VEKDATPAAVLGHVVPHDAWQLHALLQEIATDIHDDGW